MVTGRARVRDLKSIVGNFKAFAIALLLAREGHAGQGVM
jgi:hypothetical protein